VCVCVCVCVCVYVFVSPVKRSLEDLCVCDGVLCCIDAFDGEIEGGGCDFNA